MAQPRVACLQQVNDRSYSMGITRRADRERPLSICARRAGRGRSMAGVVKGFGCRPVVTYPRVMRAGVRKPPRKEPAGAGRQLAVYGDLTIRRLALWMRWPAQ